MFSKLFNKTNKSTIDVSENAEIPKEKKRFSSVDVVFGMGILILVLGATYFVRSLMTVSTTNQVVETSTSPFDVAQLENNTSQVPFSGYSKPEKPWSETKKVMKKDESSGKISDEKDPVVYRVKKEVLTGNSASFESYTQKKEPWHNQNILEENTAVKVKVPDRQKQMNTSIKENQPKEQEKILSYVCSLQPLFKKMAEKEVVYYIKQYHGDKITYLPVYLLNTWDEKGIVLKERFMAFEIDIKNEMVEIEKNRWIPALTFASCISVEGSK